MTILSIWLLAAEKTRRQDGREVAWPWGGGVIVAGAQKSRLRRVGEVCCSKFGGCSFSLSFSVGFGGGGGSSRCALVVCSLWLYEISDSGLLSFPAGVFVKSCVGEWT